VRTGVLCTSFKFLLSSRFVLRTFSSATRAIFLRFQYKEPWVNWRQRFWCSEIPMRMELSHTEDIPRKDVGLYLVDTWGTKSFLVVPVQSLIGVLPGPTG
jgi:hypothetical protein